MKTAAIIPFKSKVLQRGLNTNINIKPSKYIRKAGEKKPTNRAMFAGYCHA